MPGWLTHVFDFVAIGVIVWNAWSWGSSAARSAENLESQIRTLIQKSFFRATARVGDNLLPDDAV